MEPSTYRQQDANAEIRPLFEIRKGYYMKKGHKNVISIATLERQVSISALFKPKIMCARDGSFGSVAIIVGSLTY